MWFSLFTRQVGQQLREVLSAAERAQAIEDFSSLRKLYPKLDMGEELIQQFASPPKDPGDCVFALTTQTLSADLTTKITPCQFGGNPDCQLLRVHGLHGAGCYRFALIGSRGAGRRNLSSLPQNWPEA